MMRERERETDFYFSSLFFTGMIGSLEVVGVGKIERKAACMLANVSLICLTATRLHATDYAPWPKLLYKLTNLRVVFP